MILMLSGCGNGPPFPINDPPPTFAIHYLLAAANNILVPAFTGSNLTGYYNGTAVVSGFVPSGFTKSFGPVWVTFGSYYVVEGGYWPGQWNIVSVGGCGAGTSQNNVIVAEKYFDLECVPKIFADPGVTPSRYNSQSTALLTVNLGQAIPSGTVATYRFVDANSGVIELQYQITMNGSSTVTVDGSNDVPDGGHYLTFDFADNGYAPYGDAGMYATVSTYGYNCTPTPGHACL
ncbi:MAG: hypothetical protein M3Y72_09180 [Acidobacteriota bacterium]|nr:hypothetical protein [Acidobacteriota bacterium]